MSTGRTRRIVVAGIAAASLAALALPASAAGETPVTFSLTGGSIAIATPTDTAVLVGGGIAAVAGQAVDGTLGSTTVTDNRGGILGWNSTMKGTTFGNGNTVIPVGNAKAYVPVADAVTGLVSSTGVVTATALPYVSAATGLELSGTAQNFVKATAVIGVNTATFAPSLSVTVPADATAGDYAGTVTQTVS